MTTGVKIAVGCGIALVLAGIIAMVSIGAGAWWLKGKVEETTGDLAERAEELEAYQEKANANPFTQPADGVVQEARLLKFLEVRKQVYAVYEAHRSEFEGLKDRKDAGISDVLKVGGVMLDARLALLKGLAEVGMSEDEYHFIVQQVYHSAWAAAAEKETGKRTAETIRETARQAQDPEAAGALEELGEQAEALEAPQANVDLFRKYEADLKKYAMEGLALAGL
jgi:hypothetical protein